MERDDFFRACDYLVEHGHKFPHGQTPGAEVGGFVNVGIDKETWDAYREDPPEFLPHITDLDPEADPKLSYEQLEAAAAKANPEFHKRRLDRVLRTECRRRIIEAYGARNAEHEIQKRLRGDTTPEQDTERDRLRQVYRTLKDNLDGMDMAALESFDATDDAHWAKPA